MGRGYSWVVKTQSAKSWPNLNGGGYSWIVKTQSAKSWPNLNFMGGGWFLDSQNSKCQVLTKFEIGGGGYSWIVKTQSAKSTWNFKRCSSAVQHYHTTYFSWMFYQWRIQDFLEGVRQLPKVLLFFNFFTENCMKMKEFGPPGGIPGGPLPWIRQCLL